MSMSVKVVDPAALRASVQRLQDYVARSDLWIQQGQALIAAAPPARTSPDRHGLLIASEVAKWCADRPLPRVAP